MEGPRSFRETQLRSTIAVVMASSRASFLRRLGGVLGMLLLRALAPDRAGHQHDDDADDAADDLGAMTAIGKMQADRAEQFVERDADRAVRERTQRRHDSRIS